MAALPTLSPKSQMSKAILPATGTAGDVAALLPLGIYSASNSFLSGAADQVAYTYSKIGGNILDIELRRGGFRIQLSCKSSSIKKHAFRYSWSSDRNL